MQELSIRLSPLSVSPVTVNSRGRFTWRTAFCSSPHVPKISLRWLNSSSIESLCRIMSMEKAYGKETSEEKKEIRAEPKLSPQPIHGTLLPTPAAAGSRAQRHRGHAQLSTSVLRHTENLAEMQITACFSHDSSTSTSLFQRPENSS